MYGNSAYGNSPISGGASASSDFSVGIQPLNITINLGSPTIVSESNSGTAVITADTLNITINLTSPTVSGEATGGSGVGTPIVETGGENQNPEQFKRDPLDFRLFVKKADGVKWEIPHASFTLTEELNNDRSCTFNIVNQVGEAQADIYGVTLEFILSSEYREVEVVDYLDNVIYTGFIDEVQGAAGKGQQGIKTVTSRGWLSLLSKRYTGALREFNNQDSGSIAWSLINETQSQQYGNFGITQGLIEASKTRDRTYRYRNIMDAIQKLSSTYVSDGYEFDIDVSKVLNVFYPYRGDDRPEIVFESDSNIDSWQVRKTGLLGMANRAIVFGEGVGEDMEVVTVEGDDQYKAQYFLLEEGISDKDNSDPVLLADKGQKYVDLYSYPRKFVYIDHFYTKPLANTYQVGDRIKVVIPEEGVDSTMRVMKRTIYMDGRVSLEMQALDLQ